jgi:hypothetical protein
MEGLGALSSAIKGSSQAAEDIQTQTPQEITDLQSRREKLATPAPRFDPKTGKPLATTQEYDSETGQMVDVNPKASTGQKIWRGLRSAGVGLVTGGIPGAVVGAIEPQDIKGGQAYNAPSKQYQQAETRREQQLGATDTSLDNARKNWAEAVKARQAQASEYGKVAGLGKDIVTGATGLINAENKPDTEENKAAAKLKLNQDEFDQRRTQLSQDPALAKMSPLNKTLYLLNGKVPDPREPNEAEINAAQAARALVVFTASHGGKGPQTLEDFNQIQAAARGQLDKGKGRGTEATPQQLRAVTDKKAAGLEAANKAFAGRLYAVGAKEQYQRQLQEVQNAFEEDMSLYGQAGVHNVVSVDQKGHVTWTPEGASAAAAPAQPAPAAAAPAASAAQPPAKIDPKNLPKQVMVKGKGMRNVIGYNDKTGKVIVAPEGQ